MIAPLIGSCFCPQELPLAALLGIEILLDHHGDLEHDGVVEFAQIQSGELFDLLQTVDQRVAVDVQLAACLRDVDTTAAA